MLIPLTDLGVVLLTIAIGTYLTNSLITYLNNTVSSIPYRILCPGQSSTTESPSPVQQIYAQLLRLLSTLHPRTSPSSTFGYLSTLPNCHPPTPNHSTSAPQYPSTTTTTTPASLRTLLLTLSSIYPEHTYLIQPSPITPLTTLYSRTRHHARTVYNGEIAHLHPNGTLHVCLHPADAQLAIEQHGAIRCATGYCVLPAPRNSGELGVVGEIVKAAIWYARGTGEGVKEGMEMEEGRVGMIGEKLDWEKEDEEEENWIHAMT